MSERLVMIAPYVVVFTTFNFAISLFYNIYGLIVFKRKYTKLSHTTLSKSEKKYLADINFVNVHRNWLKKFYVRIRNYSILYFVVSEIACFAAMYLSGRCVLVCRIALFADIFLLLFWVYLLFYSRKKNKKLAEEHRENMKKAMEEYDRMKSAEHEE